MAKVDNKGDTKDRSPASFPKEKVRRYLDLVAGIADVRQQLLSGVIGLDDALKRLEVLKSAYWS